MLTATIQYGSPPDSFARIGRAVGGNSAYIDNSYPNILSSMSRSQGHYFLNQVLLRIGTYS